MLNLKRRHIIHSSLAIILTTFLIVIVASIVNDINSENVSNIQQNTPKKINMENVSTSVEIKPNRKVTDSFGTYDFKTLSDVEKEAKMMFYKKLGVTGAYPNQSLLSEAKMTDYINSVKSSISKKFGYAGIENERMRFSYNGSTFICKPIFKGDFVSGYKVCINDDNEDAPTFLKEINDFLRKYKR